MTEHPAVVFIQQAHERAEELARAATPGPWAARHRIDGSHRVIGGAHPLPGAATDNRVVHRDDGYPHDSDVVHPAADADHIALHDPAAVLRRVEAERQILAAHRPMDDGSCCCSTHVGRTLDDWFLLLLAAGWGWTESS